MCSSFSVSFMPFKNRKLYLKYNKEKNLQMSKCFIKDKFRFCMRCDILWDLSVMRN